MKKYILLLLLALFFYPAFPSNCFSYDPYYDTGAAIGKAIGSHDRGNIDKDFYSNEYYDFNNLKTIVVITRVPVEAQSYVTDSYIPLKYSNMIKTKLSKKLKNITFKTFEEAAKQYYDFHPDAAKLDGQTQATQIVNFINQTSDGLLMSNVYVYNQTSKNSNPAGNVFIDFTILPHGANDAALYYSEKRMLVPFRNKEGLSEKVLENFADKFADAIKDHK